MSFIQRSVVFGALALSACGDPTLEKRIADLEAKVDALEKAPPAGKGGPAAAPGQKDKPPPASDADEQAAGALLDEATELASKGDIEGAKGKVSELKGKYANTRTAQRASRLEGELAVYGRDAGEVQVSKWFQGKSTFAEGDATLVVFWETWCPHCQREVPKLEDTYTKFHGQGLNVIAFTRVTKSSTDEKVDQFISDNHLTFPIGKDDGAMSERFGISGIPAAAVIKGGKVVWRGHPAQLSDEMLGNWVNG